MIKNCTSTHIFVMENIPYWTTKLSLTVFLLLITPDYVQSAVECKAKLEAHGKVGNLVHFTICMERTGSKTEYMTVNLNGAISNFKRGQGQGYWYWSWKTDNRMEANVDVYIWGEEVYSAFIQLGFHTTATEHAWDYFQIHIRNGNAAGGGISPTNGNTLNPFILTPSSSTTARGNIFTEAEPKNKQPGAATSGSTAICVDDLEAVGDIGGQVVFTICLDSDFPLDGYMEYRSLNYTFNYVREGETSGGFRWVREETGDKIKILVMFTVSSDRDFGTKQVAFNDKRTESLKPFKLQITNGSELLGASSRRPSDEVSTSSTPGAVVGVVLLVLILAVVGCIVYKKRDQIVSYVNRIKATKANKEEKPPHQHPTVDNVEEEGETILSNPVYGMSKELGGQESDEPQLYLNV